MARSLFASNSPAHAVARRLADVASTEQRQQVLEEFSATELRRIQRQYRRALDALAASYAGLSDATRERVAGELRARLRTLRRVLSPSSPSQHDNRDDVPSSLLSSLRALWRPTADG